MSNTTPTHTLSVLVEDKPGVLARVASPFSRRGYNIQSLAVGATEQKHMSRMTIVVSVEESPLEQITKQLNKLINVIKIVEQDEENSVARELILVKVRADSSVRTQVIEARDAARGGDRLVRAGRQGLEQVDVRALQGAVLAHVGDDVAGAPLAVKAIEHLPQVAAVGDPAAAAQTPLSVDELDVESDGDAVAVLGDGPAAPFGAFQRCGADVHPRAAGVHGRLQRIVVADAARQFDFHVELADQIGQQFAVAASAECGVQVHQVDPLGAVTLPRLCGLQRRPVVGLTAGLALHQTHRFAVHHVDSRQQNQTHSPSTQFASSVAPASPLFSG
mgnify:CR=1 FL=1